MLHNRVVLINSGGGDCAFRTFAQAFCAPNTKWQLPPSQASLDLLNDITAKLKLGIRLNDFDVSTFDAWQETVRQHLVQEAGKNPKNIEDQLHLIFRELAVKLARADSVEYQNKTLVPFLSAFDELIAQKYNITYPPTDDIFLKYTLVKDVFNYYLSDIPQVELQRYAQLKNSNDVETEEFKKIQKKIDEAKAKISKWWTDGVSDFPDKRAGYIQFLDKMAQPREWAGNTELGYLANFAGLDQVIVKGETGELMGHETQAIIPLVGFQTQYQGELAKEVLDKLVDHRIIEQPQGANVKVLPKSKEEIKALLDPVGSAGEIQLILKLAKEFPDRKIKFDNSNIVIGASDETKSLFQNNFPLFMRLLDRGALTWDPNLKLYIFLEEARLKQRLEGVVADGLDTLLYSSVKERSTIYLKHSYGHWEATVTQQQHQKLLDLGKTVDTGYNNSNFYRIESSSPAKPKEENKKSDDVASKKTTPATKDSASKETTPPVSPRTERRRSHHPNEKKGQEFIEQYSRTLSANPIVYEDEKWKKWSETAEKYKEKAKFPNEPAERNADVKILQEMLSEVAAYGLTEDQAKVKEKYSFKEGKAPEEIDRILQVALDRLMAKKLQDQFNKEEEQERRRSPSARRRGG